MINALSDKNIHEYICHFIDGTLEEETQRVFLKYVEENQELESFIALSVQGSQTLKMLPQADYPGDLMSRLRPHMN
ncbi:MAG: hypothetical protein EA364_06400 [Balneolaceae bacterium]|nr:MAG: hypothetical protein EA364_06400 [Balneolaceae bacterium]